MRHTPPRAAAMVCLTEKELVKKDKEMQLSPFYMKAERCFDMKAAWAAKSDLFFKPESSQAAIRAEAGELHLTFVGGAFLQIRQRWPQILEARWLRALKRPYLRVEEGLSELWSAGKATSQAGNAVQLAAYYRK